MAGQPPAGCNPTALMRLGTNKEGDGVVAGAHIVTIGSFDKPLANDRALKKYGSPRSSGLTREVDGDHTEFNFDLK